MEYIFTQMKQMGIFLVLAGFLIYLSPSKEYERYIRLLAVLVITASVVSPVVALFSPQGRETIHDRMTYYYTQLLGETHEEAVRKEMLAEELEEKANLEWSEWGMEYMKEKESEGE